jgi:hypothetical protein
VKAKTSKEQRFAKSGLNHVHFNDLPKPSKIKRIFAGYSIRVCDFYSHLVVVFSSGT